jgi:hypothetical protein
MPEGGRIKAPCSVCRRVTYQSILFVADGPWEEESALIEGGYYLDRNEMLRCEGCMNISLGLSTHGPWRGMMRLRTIRHRSRAGSLAGWSI